MKGILPLAAFLAFGVWAMTTKENKLRGGVGDDTDPDDLDQDELELGREHEMEHTDDEDIAEEIAVDHLTEDPHYYTHLAELERKYIKK